jgi:error-prone DNA polymerase
LNNSYIELHCRSAFSFLRGASAPEDLISAAAKLDMPALALLDRDNLSGAPRFFKAAQEAGLRPHIGAELTGPNGFVFPLLVENRQGYQNLCRLITRMKLRAPKGEAQATYEDLEDYAHGLVLLANEEFPADALDRCVAVFGRGNIYFELQRHHLRAPQRRNHAALDRAARYQLPVLAANGVAYTESRRRALQDVMTCIREKTTLAAAGRRLAENSERHLKPAAKMKKLFADLPDAIAHTVELSARLDFTLADLGYEFPRYPVAPGETMNSFLRERTFTLARQRFQPFHARAQAQIERELKLIEKLDLAGYFLIVWDIVDFCRREGILAQGRGSAANSAVCYALGITAVDPVRMELLFERFLSEERGEWPDIDIDLPSGDDRERVIQYVYARYGKLGAAMTANAITYRGPSAVRDIGKVLGYDPEMLKRVSRFVRGWEWREADWNAESKFRDAGLDPGDPSVHRFLQLYRDIQDLPRHLGQHSGGMVVCQGALDCVVPLEPATMPGRVIIQWDKEDCADLGLVKVDLLGLGMMAVLRDSVELIRIHHNVNLDLGQLPDNDPEVYATLQKADTIGMFQVESRAQMSSLPRLCPRDFYDIAVQVAIIRPGPIVGKMLNPYLQRRLGLQKPDPLHPILEPILRRTLGVPLFQEQLLRIAMTAANFTPGQAEELRRALGFKRSVERMAEIEKKLRAGMTAQDITGDVQNLIVQSITSFARYGFPESHAISFALITYASAYLKCHYLAAFTVALLNNQPMGFYHPATLVKDAQRHGLRVLPVHVNHSPLVCDVIDARTMRLGLNYVKGLSKASREAIVEARTKQGPFASLGGLRARVPRLAPGELRQLAAVGALNLNTHRREALWESNLLPLPNGNLFNETEDRGNCPFPPMDEIERLQTDYKGVGLTVGPHPMTYSRDLANRLRVTPAKELLKLRHGLPVRVAGIVITRQRPGTAHGFLFLSLEDETGISNIIVSPDLFTRERRLITEEGFLLIGGTLQNQQGAVSVRAGYIRKFIDDTVHMPSHNFR